MPRKKKEETVEKEEIKVVDEVVVEETIEETEAPVEEVVEETEAPVEEVVEETAVVEEVAEEVAPVEPTVEIDFDKSVEIETKPSKKGRVIALTQKTATFEDGTVETFNGRVKHNYYKSLM